jgi:hypothetical protein
MSRSVLGLAYAKVDSLETPFYVFYHQTGFPDLGITHHADFQDDAE